MIPMNVDFESIVRDLRRIGWRDQKIEIICGLPEGYIYKLMAAPRLNRQYQLTASLYNFWESQLAEQPTSGASTT